MSEGVTRDPVEIKSYLADNGWQQTISHFSISPRDLSKIVGKKKKSKKKAANKKKTTAKKKAVKKKTTAKKKPAKKKTAAKKKARRNGTKKESRARAAVRAASPKVLLRRALKEMRKNFEDEKKAIDEKIASVDLALENL